MMIEGVELAVMSIFWVTDGVHHCRVGFLLKHFFIINKLMTEDSHKITQFLVKSNGPGDQAKSHRNYGVACAVLVDTIPKGKILGEEDRKNC